MAFAKILQSNMKVIAEEGDCRGSLERQLITEWKDYLGSAVAHTFGIRYLLRSRFWESDARKSEIGNKENPAKQAH